MATSGSCHLLGGVFAEGVQATLAVIALLSLVVKWRCESPRRLALVWVMDVSKQAGSGLFAHCLNLAAAELLSLGSSIGDQCAWYFINFALDTSLGVVVAWALLRLLQRVAARCHCPRLARSGEYGSERGARCRTWGVQLVAWLGITLVVKLVVISLILAAHRAFTQLSDDISLLFQGHPKLELVLVMIACPCIMNMAQFWAQDAFLKHAQQKRRGAGDAGITAPHMPPPSSKPSCDAGLHAPMLPAGTGVEHDSGHADGRRSCSSGSCDTHPDSPGDSRVTVSTSILSRNSSAQATTSLYGATSSGATSAASGGHAGGAAV